MERFNFPYHSFSTDYPVNGAKVQLGNSYEYASQPSAPPQRVFRLYFPSMIYYMTAAVDANSYPTPNVTLNPTLNMGKMEAFYNAHELWKTFEYVHPVYGLKLVRFKEPLKIPAGNPGGDGTVQPFTIELIEQP
jgi:hypothetical protein